MTHDEKNLIWYTKHKTIEESVISIELISGLLIAKNSCLSEKTPYPFVMTLIYSVPNDFFKKSIIKFIKIFILKKLI